MGHTLPAGQFGPVLYGGRGQRLRPLRDLRQARGWRRVALLALAFVTFVMLVATTTAGVLVWYGQYRLQRVDIAGISQPGDTDGDGQVDMEEITGVLNVLVVGRDSREGLTEQELRSLGTEMDSGQLTDTIMLLSLDPRRDKAALLSFPRDLMVTLCDGSRGRINSAHYVGEQLGAGGGSCLVQTVETLTLIPINHYVEGDFAGFIDVVDALGGVTLYLDRPLEDDFAGLDLPAGCVTLDGAEALGFVRARHLDNDFGRIARQQRFVHELTREVTSAGTLVNVPRLFSLVNSLSQAVHTDQSLSLSDMRRIAFSLRELGPDRLETRTVPGVQRTVGGAAYVVAKDGEAQSLFEAFRTGAIFPEQVGTKPPSEVALPDVPPVEVLNGSGTPGLASQVASLLRQRGFNVAGTGNADSFEFQRTQVVYPPHRMEEAELVARAFPGAALVPGEPAGKMRVVVGADFDPAAAPTTTLLLPAGSPGTRAARG
ncbi:MAG TPA: LCP family protein, partial [Egibacteraceae bacterium]|nr:LCP family protein [Egibacteraceae bacterium]